MIYFTSDTHFSSNRVFNYNFRPFDNVAEMDEQLIDNWNSLVSKNDTVYHLGDFGDYNVVKKLNGKVILILGNYEYKDRKVKIDEIDDNPIVMTHRPIDCHKDKFNLFGHIHKLCMIKEFGLNVGVDCHYYKPIDIERVIFFKKAMKTLYDKNVYCSINDIKN